MTWRPEPQPACPCKFCTGETPVPNLEPWPEPPQAVVTRDPELRECGVTNCTQCDPVRQWIEDTDPDPAPPPGGGDKLPARHY